MRKKNIWTGPTRAAKAERNILFLHDKPKEPTKEGPLSFVLFEFSFTSVSTVSRGHLSLVSLGLPIHVIGEVSWEPKKTSLGLLVYYSFMGVMYSMKYCCRGGRGGGLFYRMNTELVKKDFECMSISSSVFPFKTCLPIWMKQSGLEFRWKISSFTKTSLKFRAKVLVEIFHKKT